MLDELHYAYIFLQLLTITADDEICVNQMMLLPLPQPPGLSFRGFSGLGGWAKMAA